MIKKNVFVVEPGHIDKSCFGKNENIIKIVIFIDNSGVDTTTQKMFHRCG